MKIKDLMENGTSGGTSSGSIASVANPFGIMMRRPSLFGYVKPTKKTTSKQVKNKQSHK